MKTMVTKIQYWDYFLNQPQCTWNTEHWAYPETFLNKMYMKSSILENNIWKRLR